MYSPPFPFYFHNPNKLDVFKYRVSKPANKIFRMDKHTEPGTRMVEEYLDRSIFVCLRDSTYVFGTLRSYDQYHNILLEDAQEVVIIGQEYTEEFSEAYMLRGENIILIGVGTFDNSQLTQVSPTVLAEKKKHLSLDDLDYIAL
ncbi:U6 snRNA-associated Sm-like protein LSm1 [Nematocida homosporus]|uniref:U6 snRNA-associated Sm-like protein LSm1 n=1 Tax=Nematocida homosporus TaxID=1912981 RepID=UPI00221EBE08|nr:U6 snRNA-associated Sm-like protein LSm1 [Nematocida homosporus]KAI5184965.1 U6 snRNA-associated Sm-like protein LSm1 [Nematocida homosporus]